MPMSCACCGCVVFLSHIRAAARQQPGQRSRAFGRPCSELPHAWGSASGALVPWRMRWSSRQHFDVWLQRQLSGGEGVQKHDGFWASYLWPPTSSNSFCSRLKTSCVCICSSEVFPRGRPGDVALFGLAAIITLGNGTRVVCEVRRDVDAPPVRSLVGRVEADDSSDSSDAY